jgi:hypothetical protein
MACSSCLSMFIFSGDLHSPCPFLPPSNV